MNDRDPQLQVLHASAPPDCAGRRLDQLLAELFPQYSRARLQQWIRDGRVEVDGATRRPRDPVRPGAEIVLTPVAEPTGEAGPEALDLDIVFEDGHLLVMNKPPGLVVHPAAGNRTGTLLNGLLAHEPALARLPRGGIVHRLDKDTSGLMVVAKNLPAHKHLVDALQARRIGREYLALVAGRVVAGGSIDAPIGRHPSHRTRMAVVASGRPAVSHYRVAERFRAHTLLDVRLETGRTHQIRVHLAHQRMPVFGDPVYGGQPRLPAGMGADAIAWLQAFRRQALHAARLSLSHPADGRAMQWECSPPEDMLRLIAVLREDRARHGD